MCRYVGILLYEGLIEEVLTFDCATDAAAWLVQRRQKFDLDETLDSLTWDTARQLPIKFTDNKVAPFHPPSQ
jgi:hypothetical protein